MGEADVGGGFGVRRAVRLIVSFWSGG
jgi:hypothetical protein